MCGLLGKALSSIYVYSLGFFKSWICSGVAVKEMIVLCSVSAAVGCPVGHNPNLTLFSASVSLATCTALNFARFVLVMLASCCSSAFGHLGP